MKRLKIAYQKKDGRNFQGRRTNYHLGGGVSRMYRRVDFQHMLKHLIAYVIREEYDPFRSAPIFLIYYENGYFSYHLGVFGVRKGMILWSGERSPYWLGSSKPLSSFSSGSFLFNVDSKYGRSSGAKCQVLKQYEGWVLIRLPSGEEKFFRSSSWGSAGRVAGLFNRFKKERKAGMNRRRGKRPVVRGVAMNPIDHPHGGGEGKTSGGRPSVSPWGKLTKGKKTRRKK